MACAELRTSSRFFTILILTFLNSITGSIFNNQLSNGLAAYQGVIPAQVLEAVKRSVTVVFSLPAEFQRPIIDVYVSALRTTFIFGVPAMGIALISAAFVRNWNLHERGKVSTEKAEVDGDATTKST